MSLQSLLGLGVVPLLDIYCVCVGPLGPTQRELV